MRSVRMLIKKDGSAKYISHLDLNRCFTRAVRRAGVDVWYTEGFNPHPYLYFPAPLPLGVSGDREVLDIKINGDMTNEEIAKRMDIELPQGIKVLRLYDPCDDASLMWAALYEIVLEFDTVLSAEAFLTRANELLSAGELTAERPGKQGGRRVIKKVNICELIYRCELSRTQSSVRIDAVLACGGDTVLNPILLVNTLSTASGIKHEFYSIERKLFYKKDFYEFN